MTIKVTRTTTEKVQLTPPLFWRKNSPFTSATEMTGLINENTVINLFLSDGLTLVKNSDTTFHNLEECYNNWEPVSEDEFFAALNTAVERVSLQPILHEKL